MTSAKSGKFADLYGQACQFSKTVPLPSILTSHFSQTQVLWIPADKIVSKSEWFLLFDSLSHSTDIKGLCIWSHWWWKKKHALALEASQSLKLQAVQSSSFLKALPLILTLEFCEHFSKSFISCLKLSRHFTTLCLDGILFPLESIKPLSQALQKCMNLTTLSFIRCELGDQGLSELVTVIRNSRTLIHLDLSENELTEVSAALLRDALKTQALRRMEAAFPTLLRGTSSTRSSNELPSRFFLQRITLNGNFFGDTGVEDLLEALSEDLGVHIVELQSNQITNHGAKVILNFVQHHPNISLDIRKNELIDPSLLHAIMQYTDVSHLDTPSPILPPATLRPRFTSSPIRSKSRRNSSTQPRSLGPRAAWRPAGVAPIKPLCSPPPSSSPLSSSKPVSTDPLDSMHPLVQPQRICDMVHHYHVLNTKVKTLETVLKKAWESEPVQTLPLKGQLCNSTFTSLGPSLLSNPNSFHSPMNDRDEIKMSNPNHNKKMNEAITTGSPCLSSFSVIGDPFDQTKDLDSVPPSSSFFSPMHMSMESNSKETQGSGYQLRWGRLQTWLAEQVQCLHLSKENPGSTTSYEFTSQEKEYNDEIHCPNDWVSSLEYQ